MEAEKNIRLSREDWIHGALELLSSEGVEGVKIVPLAERLGVTSGSFYWHFKNRRELYDALLDHWEREMTDVPIVEAKKSEGTPQERIWKVMQQVMDSGLASYDLAIWHWAQTDVKAQTIFKRALDKRFNFACWLFQQAGFSKSQAEARGRMMAVYMMGESTLIPDTPDDRKEQLRAMYEILISS
jgi:AcrR family transcriptional regulator